MDRRQLDFHSADDVIADIKMLQSSGYRKTKNWNLSQVCEHLTTTMIGGLDGWGFRLPWIVRATYMNWEFNRAIKKRKIATGLPTLDRLKPKQATSAENEPDDQLAIDRCIETCRRTEAYNGTMIENPLLNHVTADQWKDYMWVHAAHHLSFLVPDTVPSQTRSG